jgi:hypothetical protein
MAIGNGNPLRQIAEAPKATCLMSKSAKIGRADQEFAHCVRPSTSPLSVNAKMTSVRAPIILRLVQTVKFINKWLIPQIALEFNTI